MESYKQTAAILASTSSLKPSPTSETASTKSEEETTIASKLSDNSPLPGEASNNPINSSFTKTIVTNLPIHSNISQSLTPTTVKQTDNLGSKVNLTVSSYTTEAATQLPHVDSFATSSTWTTRQINFIPNSDKASKNTSGEGISKKRGNLLESEDKTNIDLTDSIKSLKHLISEVISKSTRDKFTHKPYHNLEWKERRTHLRNDIPQPFYEPDSSSYFHEPTYEPSSVHDFTKSSMGQTPELSAGSWKDRTEHIPEQTQHDIYLKGHLASIEKREVNNEELATTDYDTKSFGYASFIIGGCSSQHKAILSVEAYNSDSKIVVPDTPFLGCGPPVGAIYKKALVVCANSVSNILNSCYHYKAGFATWKTYPSMLVSRKDFTFSVTDDSIVAIGGQTAGPDLEIFRNGGWEQGPNMRSNGSRKKHCSVRYYCYHFQDF